MSKPKEYVRLAVELDDDGVFVCMVEDAHGPWMHSKVALRWRARAQAAESTLAAVRAVLSAAQADANHDFVDALLQPIWDVLSPAPQPGPVLEACAAN